MASEEITISELELADSVLGDMVLAVDTTTDTKAVSLRQLKAWLGSSLPTGFIIPAVGRITDERFTLLDGKTISRTGSYEAFCNKVVEQVQAGNWFACTTSEYEADLTNYGQCGKFVITNDYVRIPKITRYIGATITLSEIGRAYAESLPNIKGEINASNVYSDIVDAGINDISGAFQGTFGNLRPDIHTSDTYIQAPTSLKFDASESSSVYQNNAKVNPENIKYPYYMVVSTEGQTSPVEIDINEVYEDLNLKADIAYVDARMPTGTILPYGGSTAPSGFLLCNGGAVSRTTYASLFAVIGTTYGAGDGSTTFNLPNGKMPIGLTAQSKVIGDGYPIKVKTVNPNPNTENKKVSVLSWGTSNDASGWAMPAMSKTLNPVNVNEFVYINDNSDNDLDAGLKGIVDLTTASAVSNAIIKY